MHDIYDSAACITGGKDMQALDYSKIGERIRQVRKAKGWSQETLAKKCGISLNFMGKIERGDRKMSMDTFARDRCRCVVVGHCKNGGTGCRKYVEAFSEKRLGQLFDVYPDYEISCRYYQ